MPVTASHPTGTVSFSVTGGTGTFSPAICTLSSAVPAADSTCTLTYTPNTLGTGTHTLEATYAGDTSPIQFASSSGTDTLAVTPANTAPTAASQSVSTNEDTGKLITLSATDAQQCELTFTVLTGPSHGSLGAVTSQTCASGTPNDAEPLVQAAARVALAKIEPR